MIFFTSLFKTIPKYGRMNVTKPSAKGGFNTYIKQTSDKWIQFQHTKTNRSQHSCDNFVVNNKI